MKIGYLGTGAWGFCLATLLARKGYQVVAWSIDLPLIKKLNEEKKHPLFPDFEIKGDITFTPNLPEVLDGIDLLVESVTSAGMRPVFEEIKKIKVPDCPIVITSKGIEQDSELILSDVVTQVLGEKYRQQIGAIGGPSFAQEVIKSLPTSVVGTAYDKDVMMSICKIFTTESFRVYPNSDIKGVAIGGALKNIIAIACGICEGLHLGNSAKAALITRGLHEIRKLAVARGCKTETLYGLSGLGDLTLTCSSPMSRNYKFGTHIARGKVPKEAQKLIGMVVEGAYTCVSAHQMSEQLNIPMPITETIYSIIYQGMKPTEAVKNLMQRTIKEEHL